MGDMADGIFTKRDEASGQTIAPCLEPHSQATGCLARADRLLVVV